MDTLYYNGTIRTMEHFAPEEALLVRDGRVAAVGPFAQLLDQCTYTKKVNLAGACLMPAFLDAHSHITAVAATLDLCHGQAPGGPGRRGGLPGHCGGHGALCPGA